MKNYFDLYLQKEKPLCREERQYAMYLCWKLSNMVNRENPEDKAVLEACGLPTDSGLLIRSVAYEVAYMRDFFWQDRVVRAKKKCLNYNEVLGEKKEDCFNKRLYEYVRALFGGKEFASVVPINRNLGGKIQWRSLDEEIVRCFRQMMNSKPDIAVYYEYKGEKHLKFLECKYLSEVKNYGGVSQLEIQTRICDFLCREILNIISDEVRLVQFKEKREGNERNVMELKELIPDNFSLDKQGLMH